VRIQTLRLTGTHEVSWEMDDDEGRQKYARRQPHLCFTESAALHQFRGPEAAFCFQIVLLNSVPERIQDARDSSRRRWRTLRTRTHCGGALGRQHSLRHRLLQWLVWKLAPVDGGSRRTGERPDE
jgi:hypothetical protein